MNQTNSFFKSLAWTILLITSFGSLQAQTLVWEENFNTTINPTKWTYDFGNGSERDAGWGWGNSELEYYTSRTDNARIENGSLVIEAKQEAFQGSAFTSARLKTEGRVHFKYGTVEARMKLPNLTRGLWPAFWMLGTIGGGWPSIGEIDMMESGSAAALAANNANRSISSAAHWSKADGSHDYNVASTTAAVDLSLDYHLYKMVWTPQYIKMYLDNVEYYSFDISNPAAPYYHEFHNPHFLLVNLAVGGAYTGIYNQAGITAPLPGKFYVDYIRLYQNPDGVLDLAENTALTGNFGVLTDNTPVTSALTYGTNAELYYWNNLTNIPNPVPYEGANVWAVHANAGDWFGMGVQNDYRNLSNFADGALRFRFKSTYQGQFKIGVKTGHGESWINFAANTTAYGLLRNGTWSEVIIPLSEFQNPSLGRNIDLYTLKNAFMFAGDVAAGAADFYFDDVYYSGGIAANPPPTVSITSPVNNAIITTPNNLVINADAADTNGTVTQVEFFNGTTSLGIDATSPYSVTLNTPSVGTYILTAKATDNEGAMTTSTPVTVFVSSPTNTPPTANITSPANNAAFLTPSNITINATATDADGSIFKVEFYKDATLLGSSTTAPYTYTWTGATVGNYALTVKATDNGGLTTTSSVVNISVSNPIKPTVSITSPTNNSSFVAPASITINADAADANGTVTQVDFYNGTTLIGTDATSPYSFTWNNVAIGNYVLTAKATDNDGNETVSTAVNIAVNVAATPGYCATAVNGDYAYKAVTNNGVVTFTFHPLSPITGCNLALIYIREGASGGYAGYNMTPAGADFVYTKTIANNTSLSIYFTYNTPPAGERNSSANPHSYTVGTSCLSSTNTPITAAPVPTRPAANVLSLFSNTYTNVAGTDWFPNWSQTTVVEDTLITGNTTKKYTNFNYQGVQFASPINVSTMQSLHIDLWTPNCTAFDVYLINTSPALVEQKVTLTPTLSGWNSFDIPLSSFNTIALNNIGQFKFVGVPFGTSKVYLDNIYFHNTPSTSSITAAPTPTRAAANVISLYSNAYTNRTVDTWSAAWDNADVTDTIISGNDTKIYSNLNFAGIEFTSNTINATAMTHFHIDIWTPNSTVFKVKLVDFGANGVYNGGGDDREHELTFTPTLNGWVSYDLPLSDFVNMTTRAHLAQLLLVGSNSKVYVDNIYFYNNTAIPVELTSFKAKIVNSTTVLNWQTASERDNQGFTIERSTNGTSYNAIGQVKGNGTTSVVHDYTFTDTDPSVGINYYRLRQADFNGKETLSSVVSVILGKNGLVLKGNVVHNVLDVTVNDEKATTLRIFNTIGQQVFIAKVQGSQRLDISNLATGLYIIATDKGETERFVKE